MAKVITFSRTFPSYHPRKGQPTYFVEKFLQAFSYERTGKIPGCPDIVDYIDFDKYYSMPPKWHTIRAGHRFKVGDYFSPRIWSGKPYNSKQIIICPDTEIKKIWDFKVVKDGIFSQMYINDRPIFTHQAEKLFKNDGLTCEDFVEWFQLPKDFDGQIICWNENINY